MKPFSRRRKGTLAYRLPLRGAWRVNAACLTLAGIVLCLLTIWGHLQWKVTEHSHQALNLKPLNWTLVDHTRTHKSSCSFHTCFDVSRCEFSVEDAVGVYVGGWYEFHAPQTPGVVSPVASVEYAELVEAVKGSRYHVSDPSRACIFIPPLDTLSKGRARVAAMATFLNSLPE